MTCEEAPALAAVRPVHRSLQTKWFRIATRGRQASASPRGPVHERQAAHIARREAVLLSCGYQNERLPIRPLRVVANKVGLRGRQPGLGEFQPVRVVLNKGGRSIAIDLLPKHRVGTASEHQERTLRPRCYCLDDRFQFDRVQLNTLKVLAARDRR